MIEHKYGKYTDKQFDEYKTKLHKKLFWLLIYKDPNTKDQFPNVDTYAFEQYFDHIMHEIDGMNALLFYPPEICSIMSLLESALHETQKENFDYKFYRKLVLDAHALVDKIPPYGEKYDKSKSV